MSDLEDKVRAIKDKPWEIIFYKIMKYVDERIDKLHDVKQKVYSTHPSDSLQEVLNLILTVNS